MPLLANNNYALNDPRFKQDFKYRNDSGSIDHTTGKWIEVIGSQIDASGSIQPVARNEYHEMLKFLDGGSRIESAIIIYTMADLICAENLDGNGSMIRYNNLDWKVIDIEDYSAHGHKEVIAVRVYGQIDIIVPAVYMTDTDGFTMSIGGAKLSVAQ